MVAELTVIGIQATGGTPQGVTEVLLEEELLPGIEADGVLLVHGALVFEAVDIVQVVAPFAIVPQLRCLNLVLPLAMKGGNHLLGVQAGQCQGLHEIHLLLGVQAKTDPFHHPVAQTERVW